MDVILHLGAHRTGTTSFQDYLRRHADGLADLGLGACVPMAERPLSAHGMSTVQQHTRDQDRGRVRAALEGARKQGLKKLLVSDADMMGTLCENVSACTLYPKAAQHIARRIAACDGRISAVLISIRSLEVFWCSALAESVMLRGKLPDRETMASIAASKRSWRDVIADVAEALPEVPLRVYPFEPFAGQPDVFLETALGCAAPFDRARTHLRRTPTLPDLRRELSRRGSLDAPLPFGMGRWTPFTNEEYAALREAHADDMMWLTSGADGLATLIPGRQRHRAEDNPPPKAQQEGQRDEFKERHLARPRRG